MIVNELDKVPIKLLEYTYSQCFVELPRSSTPADNGIILFAFVIEFKFIPLEAVMSIVLFFNNLISE